ncbi:hypothetical protein D3C87_1391310 [compost metagenome]
MNYYEGDNIGACAKAEFIEHYNLASFNPAVPLAGESWTEIPFKVETCQLQIKILNTENGPVYTYSGKWKMHNMRDEVDDVMFKLVGQITVLRLTDMNGRIYVIGAPGMPVNISINQDTGERFVNENGSEFIFSIDQPFAAVKA